MMGRGLLVVLACLPMLGCGLALRYKSEEVQIVTPEVSGAKCDLTDKRGRKWQVDATPGTVSVAGGASPIAIICQKRGYKPAVVMLESLNFWRHNDHLPLTGASMGDMSASGRTYPAAVEVWMEPSTWREEEEHKAWLIRRARAHLADVQVLVHPRHAQDNPPLTPQTAKDYWQSEEDWAVWIRGQ